MLLCLLAEQSYSPAEQERPSSAGFPSSRCSSPSAEVFRRRCSAAGRGSAHAEQDELRRERGGRQRHGGGPAAAPGPRDGSASPLLACSIDATAGDKAAPVRGLEQLRGGATNFRTVLQATGGRTTAGCQARTACVFIYHTLEVYKDSHRHGGKRAARSRQSAGARSQASACSLSQSARS